MCNALRHRHGNCIKSVTNNTNNYYYAEYIKNTNERQKIEIICDRVASASLFGNSNP